MNGFTPCLAPPRLAPPRPASPRPAPPGRALPRAGLAPHPGRTDFGTVWRHEQEQRGGYALRPSRAGRGGSGFGQEPGGSVVGRPLNGVATPARCDVI